MDVTQGDMAAVVDRSQDQLPTRWLTWVQYSTPIGAAFQVLNLLFLQTYMAAGATFALELVPAVALGWGLRKRRYWAYQLNWLFLGAAVLQAGWRCLFGKLSLLGCVIVLVYVLANLRYFRRRRHMFT
jgi:hypothetical protein